MADLPPEPSPLKDLFEAPAGPLRILGSRVDPLSFQLALQRICQLARGQASSQVITANTLMLLEAERDKELRDILESAAVVVPESWGVRWASRRYGRPLREFVPGIDLLSALCAVAAQLRQRLFLLGAAPGVAEDAGRQLAAQHPGLLIAGTHHGFFSRGEERMLLDKIHEARPVYLFVGMGVPAQEKWIASRLAALRVPVVMGVGGSFDVLSGRLRRAPLWVQRLGVEWVFRTLQQPWRLGRLKGLPIFMSHVRRDARPS